MPPINESLAARFPQRATRWQLRTRTLEFGKRPLVVGIVNVTPDSFSDGGKFLCASAAMEQGLALAAEGASLIDVGGESTRPYSTPVSEEEELRRVLPVVAELAAKVGVPISIDTSKARVARECLAAGAEVINDVTGLQGDPDMPGVAREFGAGVCVMHMQGTPQTMQDNPTYVNVVLEVRDFLRARLEGLVNAGVEQARICLDPGIGFGKTHQHNLDLVAGCGRLHELGAPVLVGHSRKGFMGKVLGNKEVDRTFATLGVSLALARQGIQLLRVHDVRATREALLLFEAVGGIDGAAGKIEE